MSRYKVGETTGLSGCKLVARWACAHPEATAGETNLLIGTVIDGIKIKESMVHRGRKLLSDNTPHLHRELGVDTAVFMIAAKSIRSQSSARKAHDSRKKAKKNARALGSDVVDENSLFTGFDNPPARKKRKDAKQGKLDGTILVKEQPRREITASSAAAADTTGVDDHVITDVHTNGVPEIVVARYIAEIAAEFPPTNRIEAQANAELLEEKLDAYRRRHQNRE